MTISGGISNGVPGQDLSYRLTTAASDAFRIVTTDATNSTRLNRTAVIAAASTAPAIGILQNGVTAANEQVAVRISGISALIVNGNSVNIAAGDQIVATTAGVGIKIAAVGATAQHVIGIAQEPATTDGATIDILIQQAHVVKGTA